MAWIGEGFMMSSEEFVDKMLSTLKAEDFFVPSVFSFIFLNRMDFRIAIYGRKNNQKQICFAKICL